MAAVPLVVAGGFVLNTGLRRVAPVKPMRERTSLPVGLVLKMVGITVAVAAVIIGIYQHQAGANFYSDLGVPAASSKADIKASCRRILAEAHPDRNKSPGSEDDFLRRRSMCELLTDETLRLVYDRFGPDMAAQKNVDAILQSPTGMFFFYAPAYAGIFVLIMIVTNGRESAAARTLNLVLLLVLFLVELFARHDGLNFFPDAIMPSATIADKVMALRFLAIFAMLLINYIIASTFVDQALIRYVELLERQDGILEAIDNLQATLGGLLARGAGAGAASTALLPNATGTRPLNAHKRKPAAAVVAEQAAAAESGWSFGKIINTLLVVIWLSNLFTKSG